MNYTLDESTPRMGEMDKQRMGMETKKQNNRMQSRTMGMAMSGMSDIAEQVYCAINEHMCKAISFHEQLADYFCFLGLQGFKRMLEYQYMNECATKRKLHKRYIDTHHKLIPVKQVELPMFIPSDWNRYTTKDINDSVIPKFVRSALSEYYDWEEKTKRIYEEQCTMLMDANMVADYEFVKELIVDVEKEIKKIHRMMENLNGTGYDVNMVHGMQDKYHEKYKKKYQDKFTTKNNYRSYPYRDMDYDDDMEYEQRRTRRMIGF